MIQSALIIGCGYVGTSLAQLWTKRGIKVIATTSRHERIPELTSFCSEALVLHSSDLTALAQLLKRVDCVAVTVAAKNSNAYQSAYLDTALTLQHALNDNDTVRHLVYTSSTSVYGDHQGQHVNELTPLTPSSLQTEILAKTEQVLLSIRASHRNVCILRCGEITGPNREVPRRLQQRLSAPLPGNGMSITNIVHRDDVARAIAFSADHSLSGIYNLCNDLHVTRKHLYDLVCDAMKWPRPLWNPDAQSLHGGNRIVDNQKICQAGFAFQYPDMKVIWQHSKESTGAENDPPRRL